MLRLWFLLLGAGLLLTGCDNDDTRPRDVTPPAAPRGFFSVTGNGSVRLQWLANTDSDVAGYKVYMASCASGPSCPYDPVGVTGGTSFLVTLANGRTRYFAVAAYDHAGNESPLTREDVFDTPRPAGSGLVLASFTASPALSGYDFSAFAVVPFDGPNTDVFFGYNGSIYQMFAPYTDTDIQDAGYTSSLDDVDFAPLSGWSRNGTVELIEGHSYVVRVSGALGYNYAKFRVVALSASPARTVLDWAYQEVPDNRELAAGGGRSESDPRRERRPVVWLR